MNIHTSLALVTTLLIAGLSSAGDTKLDAIKKDRQLYQGTWQVVSLTVNGDKVFDGDAKNIQVVNEADGTWTLQVEGKVIAKGTSTLDPTKKPKAIDLTATEGESKGQTVLGIYDIEKDTRKLCYADPGKGRPTEFSSKPASGNNLVVFKRVKKVVLEQNVSTPPAEIESPPA